MKPLTFCAGALLALASLTASAQQGDPLSQFLIPPHLIMEKGGEIGLSDAQRQAVQQLAERIHQQSSEKRGPLEKAMQALAAELAREPVDTNAARVRLDAVLDAERAMKQLQLELLVGANNALTPGQRKALQQMRGKAAAGHPANPQDLEKRLKGKLQRIQQRMQAKREAGEHPLEIPDMMERFPQLMEQGKHREAEHLLDEVLRVLGGNQQPPVPGTSSRRAATPEPPVARKSVEELEAEISAKQVEEVAWRKIPWRTCLLDGVQESRAENKPLLLWVFIDRPVDDKRC